MGQGERGLVPETELKSKVQVKLHFFCKKITTHIETPCRGVIVYLKNDERASCTVRQIER